MWRAWWFGREATLLQQSRQGRTAGPHRSVDQGKAGGEPLCLGGAILGAQPLIGTCGDRIAQSLLHRPQAIHEADGSWAARGAPDARCPPTRSEAPATEPVSGEQPWSSRRCPVPGSKKHSAPGLNYPFAALTLSRKPSGNAVAFIFGPSRFRVTQQTTSFPVAIGVSCSPSRRLNSIR